MSVFGAADFAEHEQVVFAADAETGLRAVIAIHDTTLMGAVVNDDALRRLQVKIAAGAANNQLADYRLRRERASPQRAVA